MSDRDRKRFELRYRYFHPAKLAVGHPRNFWRMRETRETIRRRFWGDARSIGIVPGVCYTPAPGGMAECATELAGKQGLA